MLPIIKELVHENKAIFVKGIDSSGGKSVFRFEQCSSFDLSVLNLNEDYLIEKGLIQHDSLNQINPYCINSLRIITLNRNGEIKIPSSFLRLGINKSPIDNASSGGIFINYDLKKNKLDEVAVKLAIMGGDSYYSHPNTHYIFKDQPLPYPEKVAELVIKAAKIIPDKDIIGWDIAYTSEGPVILEGNKNPCPTATQISLRGLKNSKTYDEFYSEFYN